MSHYTAASVVWLNELRVQDGRLLKSLTSHLIQLDPMLGLTARGANRAVSLFEIEVGF